MLEKDYVRSLLPSDTVESFDDIALSRVLGASKQTKLICKMMASVASSKDKLTTIAEYYKQTRGQNSRAIYNAIADLESKILPLYENNDYSLILDLINGYEDYLASNTSKSAEYAAVLCESYDTIMIFDYSSTVDEFVTRLKSKKTIYIPESRALNGGKPFLKNAVKCGHDVHFIPDTTMLVELKKCQAAFIGAETIYPDGSVFNTIGADILGILCKEINVPLYAISPMIKTDIRNIYGYTKLAPMPYDYSVRLAVGWNEGEKENIDFKGIKLVKIDSKYINGIITEKGIIPSYAFYSEALKYIESMEA